MVLPHVVAHADWGTKPKKRMVSIARLLPDRRYIVEVPRRVATTGSWHERLGIPAGTSGPILIGFDFPIGIAAAYAKRVGITSFRDALGSFGEGDWRDFYKVCGSAAEISLRRPFFPNSCPVAGACSRDDLTNALGIPWNDLYRQCELRTADRRAACPLFWTLGGNQVGKAALAGWREFVQPMVAHAADAGLWPFDAPLSELLQSCSCVIVETYPTEYYAHLGVRFAGGKDGGKRSPSARLQQVKTLLAAIDVLDVELSRAAHDAIAAGFGPGTDGEDDFDAMVGLLGIMRHLRAGCTVEPPPDPVVKAVEGWILGQKPAALSTREKPA